MQGQVMPYLVRIKPEQNMYRYYAVDIEPGLFGWVVRRHWGRKDGGFHPRRQRVKVMKNRFAARVLSGCWAWRKRIKGYTWPTNFH
jgi:predicted DNA-binding WGR domain protein